MRLVKAPPLTLLVVQVLGWGDCSGPGKNSTTRWYWYPL